MSQDNEQYRAGFEAWARKKGFDIDRYDWAEYRSRPTQLAWETWVAAKREASTEPSALAEAIKSLPHVHGRGNFGKQADFDHYAEGHEEARNEAAKLVLEAAGALTDDAKNAVLSPGLRAVLVFLDGAAPLDGVWFGERHPTASGKYWWRRELRAAILAQAKAGSGKGEG